MMEEKTSVTEQPLFTEEDLLGSYTEASKGQRFFNLLIDVIVIRYVVTYIIGASIGYLLLYVAPDLMNALIEERVTFGYLFAAYIIGVCNYLFYYTLCEKLFKGYTLGKLITGTRAIREDGHELTWKDAFLRTLSRVVPFEALSGFGYRPWHDTWTNTVVIKSR